jgi:hypothetical protein
VSDAVGDARPMVFWPRGRLLKYAILPAGGAPGSLVTYPDGAIARQRRPVVPCHGIGKFMFWDDSSLFMAYSPGSWHANGALIPGRMPGMPGLHTRAL